MSATVTHIQKHRNFQKPKPSLITRHVEFHGKKIVTTVTNSASVAYNWISEIQRIFHTERRDSLTVGLDVERKFQPHMKGVQPVATLQLCVGRRCLIFQFLNMDYIPRLLGDFLSDPCNTFVGVGIDDDVHGLMDDYGLEVVKWLDLRSLAVEKLKKAEYKRSGLKSLALDVLGVHLKKEKNVTLSNWALMRLNEQQIEYACIDAASSLDIGLDLIRREEVL